MDIKQNKAFIYAKSTLKDKNVPKYVKKQCKIFIDIAEEKDKKYTIDLHKVAQIEAILKLLIMPRGLKAGQSLYECTTNYQWLFYIAVLCVVYRENPKKRRYETAILEIARKNFKTYTVATIFILLFLLEPKMSKFYSVAPDGQLSREVREAIAETIKSSPLIYEYKEKKRFKILRDYIECLLNENKFIPLNYSTSRMDGKLPNVFVADEVGALPSNYPIEAMRSGQLNILNKLGCIISTKYPTANNPFEDEVSYAKKVLDGTQEDETYFALLYEPDNTKRWMKDDKILRQANPVSLEIPEIWDDLIKKRAKAIAMEQTRENFLTKHCNITYTGTASESFVNIADVQQCRVTKIDWRGKEVYVGVDLAMTNDNCAVSIVGLDENNNILIESIAFIPEGRIEEKDLAERIRYEDFISAKKCIACGDKTVDYKVVEDFVFDIEKNYGVIIRAIGYDRFNAMSSAQKWAEKYQVVEIRQHSDTLHPPTKLLSEKIANHEIQYEKNTLLEINFENARCTYDTNMNRYVNKKKSNGKVDMVMASIDAIFLLQQDIIFDTGFIVQT